MVLIIVMMEKQPACAELYIRTPWRGSQPKEFLLHSDAMEASKTHIDYVRSYIHLRHPARTMNAVVHISLEKKARYTENLPQRTVETLTVLLNSYSRDSRAHIFRKKGKIHRNLTTKISRNTDSTSEFLFERQSYRYSLAASVVLTTAVCPPN
jgi:hypothetical protein